MISGRQILSSVDQVEADTHWHTHTCVLGFSIMGVWPRDSDGTDINALQVIARISYPRLKHALAKLPFSVRT